MMHKIILQISKNRKSHGLLNLKLMDCTSYCFFLWTMIYGPLIDKMYVRDLKLVKYHNKKTKGQKKLNSRIIFIMDF
jgi:hypothetical protein